MTTLEKFELKDSSFNRLMSIHESKLRKFALQLTKDADLAEDLYQDTSIKIFINIEKLTGDNLFINWSMQIMKNTFLDYLRKDSRRLKPCSWEEMTSYLGMEVDFEDTSVDIEADFLLKNDNETPARKIRELISSLPAQKKEILSYAIYSQSTPPVDIDFESDGEMDYKSIAKAINKDTGTVRSRLHRAKDTLRKMAGISST